jgi:hypothetical protein
MQSIHRDEYAWEAGAATYVEDAVWLPVDRALDKATSMSSFAGLPS